MQLGKVQSRGQITLPSSVRQAAAIEPGDVVAFEVVGPGRLELRALPRQRLAETFARYHIEGPIDDATDREDWQNQAAGDVIGA